MEKYEPSIKPADKRSIARPQPIHERLVLLETLALNQTLMIGHLTQVVSAMMPPAARARALDSSAEDLLTLVFTEGVPIDLLDLAIEWRKQIASPDIMLTS